MAIECCQAELAEAGFDRLSLTAFQTHALKNNRH